MLLALNLLGCHALLLGQRCDHRHLHLLPVLPGPHQAICALRLGLAVTKTCDQLRNRDTSLYQLSPCSESHFLCSAAAFALDNVQTSFALKLPAFFFKYIVNRTFLRLVKHVLKGSPGH